MTFTKIRQIIMAMVLNQMGRLLARRGVSQAANWCFTEALRLSPAKGNGLFEAAQLRWMVQDYNATRQLLESLLAVQPQHAQALNLLGVIAYVQERYDDAIRFAREAIELKPEWAAPHNNLGNALLAQDDFVTAQKSFRQALRCDPEYAEAWCNLALLLNRDGQYEEAEQAARTAIRIKPDFAGAISNLGSILINLGRIAEGVQTYRKALELQPDLIEAQINLAAAVEEPGRLVGAMGHFQNILQHHPNSYSALMRLAQGHLALGEFDQAEDYVKRVLELQPESLDAHILLATIAIKQGLIQRALDLNRKAQAIGAGQGAAIMSIFQSLYDGKNDSAYIYEMIRTFVRNSLSEPTLLTHDQKTMSYLPLSRRESSRKLRIGYVSKDFVRHSVACFLEPIITHHDRDRFFICCYANLFHPDQVTERFKQHADLWREIALVNDDDLEKQIHEDEIDVLVDLSGYTAGSLLSLFARKPAPVQVTYLGFPATTGLSTIDYRLVDAVTDPASDEDRFYTESLWRLPGCFLTYQPLANAPAAVSPPFLKNGYITFGSFNTAPKATEDVVEIWSRILKCVPGSRLMLKSMTFASERGKAYYQSLFEKQGLGADRVELFDWHPDPTGHLGLYSKVDIALDTFPYNGTTTTCEALWMGVPVITLKGHRHLSRVGTSLLTQLDLTELIADSVDDYVQCAINLANDPDQLIALRAGMRERMRVSPLLDHAGFTRRLEDAYREMIDIAVQVEKQAS